MHATATYYTETKGFTTDGNSADYACKNLYTCGIMSAEDAITPK